MADSLSRQSLHDMEWYLCISLCVWSHKFRKLPTKEHTLNYNIFGRVYVNLWVFSFRSIYLAQNTPFSHIFSNQNLSVCLSYLFMPFCDGIRQMTQHRKIYSLKFLQSTTPFQCAEREREKEHVSPPLPLSLSVCLSVWRNHSYFIKLTDYGCPCSALASLLLFFSLLFSSLYSFFLALLRLARWLHCYANCSQWLRLMVKCVKLHSKS